MYKNIKDVRKLPFRLAPNIIPQELLGLSFPCLQCGEPIEIPWLEKLKFPIHPVKHNSEKGHWVPVSIPLDCLQPGCLYKNTIKIPIKPIDASWGLFGDEAARYISNPHQIISKDPLHFFCITLIGLHIDSWEKVKSAIREAKIGIRPDFDPDSWTHHFNEIWNTRPDTNKFILESKEAKINYANRFANIIQSARPALTSFNISSCIIVPKNKKERRIAINSQKKNIFSQAILTSLKIMRDYDKQIHWIFDNIKDSTNKIPTEGWASECFLGLQYTRLFTWLSSGTIVVPPKFVKPGSHFLLEVADFISFWIAREFELRAKNKQAEISSAALGNGFYQATIKNGNAHYKWSTGCPFKEYYSI